MSFTRNKDWTFYVFERLDGEGSWRYVDMRVTTTPEGACELYLGDFLHRYQKANEGRTTKEIGVSVTSPPENGHTLTSEIESTFVYEYRGW